MNNDAYLSEFLLLQIVLPIFLPSLAASYFASLSCRFVHWRHHPVRWWLGLVSPVAAGVSVVCFVWLGLSLRHGEDAYGMGRILCMYCIAGSLLAVIPAEIVVWRYRKAYRKVEHVV